MNNDQELKKVSSQIFSTLYSSYDRVVMYFTFFQDLKWKSEVSNAIKIRKEEKILDVGIGTGLFEELFTERPASSIYGLDMSNEMLQICMKKKLTSIEELIQADAENLPFREGSFNAVISCYVIKYCNQKRFLAEIYRILKYKGRAAIYDFSKPRGLSLHFIYLRAVLPLLGYLFLGLGKKLSITFMKLPEIVMHSEWERSVVREMNEIGFNSVRDKVMSSGGARIIVAIK